jgi:hypothetical protein
MRNRKRDKNSRQVSTRKISEDHVTIFYIEDGPEIEICSEEITRGMYGSKKAIYFLFRVTVPNAEKIKKDLQLKFDFCADWWDEDHSWEEADKRKEKVPVLRVSPQSIRTSVNPVDRAESYGLEGVVDANGGRFGALWNDAKAWTELGFWELKGEQKSYDITASLKKHGHKAPLMPVPFNLQFVIQDDDQTRFFIACDVDWTRKGIRISDDGWTGHWREVDMTGRDTEEKNIRSWADEKWEAKGNPIGFEKT